MPAFGAEPARTVTRNYAVSGNPLVTSVSDAAGTITTTTDLLGRVVSYTDVWAKTTTSTYDQPGRLTDTSGPAGTVHTDYDLAGRVTAQKLDGVTAATPTYSTAAELASVTYGNGTALSAIARDQAGATTGLTFLQAGGAALTTDAVVRSQSGKVVDETVDGADPHVGNNFVYDGMGRLTSAWVPGHAYTYAFAPTGGCGSAPGAGKNTNRTSMTDNGVPKTYCHDAADRLTSSTDTAVGTPAYDAHGNTTTLGTQTLGYDGADRHVTTTAAPTSLRYSRDATDRIVSRDTGVAPLATRYGYSGDGDASDFTMDVLGTVTERTLSLMGGVLLTKRLTGDVWSYPNVHGDVVATASAAGAKQGATLSYDPYGSALTAVPDNSAGNYDYGWLGQHQRGLEHEGTLATIEMGARQYVPSVGRFLEVDPVEGGSANDYDYVEGDPVNKFDLNGTDVCSGKSRRHTPYNFRSKHHGQVHLRCGWYDRRTGRGEGWRGIEGKHFQLNGFWSGGARNLSLIKYTLMNPSNNVSATFRLRADGLPSVTYISRVRTCHCGATVQMAVVINPLTGDIITAYKLNHEGH